MRLLWLCLIAMVHASTKDLERSLKEFWRDMDSDSTPEEEIRPMEHVPRERLPERKRNSLIDPDFEDPNDEPPVEDDTILGPPRATGEGIPVDVPRPGPTRLPKNDNFKWTLPMDCQSNRERKEIRDLSVDERSQFLNTLSRFMMTAEYEQLLDKYVQLWDNAHFQPRFLPWHRAFLVEMEEKMSLFAGKSIAMPYYDFTLDASNPGLSVLFSKDFVGNHDQGGIVIDSVFSRLNGFQVQGKTCIRTFDKNHMTAFYHKKLMEDILNPEKSFSQMSKDFEYGPHLNVHSHIGGHMNSKFSPADPLFWLFHSAVDKMFNEWQQKKDNVKKYDGEQYGSEWATETAKAELYPFNVDVEFVLNIKNLCISYQEPGPQAYSLSVDYKDANHPNNTIRIPDPVSEETIKSQGGNPDEGRSTQEKIEKNAQRFNSANSISLNFFGCFHVKGSCQQGSLNAFESIETARKAAQSIHESFGTGASDFKTFDGVTFDGMELKVPDSLPKNNFLSEFVNEVRRLEPNWCLTVRAETNMYLGPFDRQLELIKKPNWDFVAVVFESYRYRDLVLKPSIQKAYNAWLSIATPIFFFTDLWAGSPYDEFVNYFSFLGIPKEVRFPPLGDKDLTISLINDVKYSWSSGKILTKTTTISSTPTA